MKLIAKLKLPLLIALLLLPLAMPASFVAAAAPCSKSSSVDEAYKGIGVTGGECSGQAAGNQINKVIKNVINLISVIVGVVAVIMIIVGGFKYVTSGGDAAKVGSAKSTIIYAIVGLIVVALAQVIVQFVLKKV